jgi:protein O-mannosyl-transferase
MKSLLNVLLIVVLIFASFARNSLWQNDLRLWSDVLEHTPWKTRAFNELGIYYTKAGEYEKAIQVLGKALTLNRNQSQSYINLGMAYEGLNRIGPAREMYETAIQYDKTNSTAYYNLGVLYYTELQEQDKAFDMLQKARDLNPNEPDVHLYLSYIYDDRGDYARAEQEYQLHLQLK